MTINPTKIRMNHNSMTTHHPPSHEISLRTISNNRAVVGRNMGEQTPYFISVVEALEIAYQTPLPITSEVVELAQADNRLLASDLISPIDDPPFDNSAMDGWAVQYQDTTSAREEAPVKLEIIGTVQAAETSTPPPVVGAGQAMRIMTGAPMPEGADSIIQIEHTTVSKDEKQVALHFPSKPNFIRRCGENLVAGQIVFPSGTLLTPERLGLCATMGFGELKVQSKLKIAIISTGDEIIPLGQELKPGQIYESNSHGLAALVKWLGHEPTIHPNVADNLNSLRKALDQAAKSADIIITSGGVSMGEFDFVRKIMEEEGDVHFWRVKLRPGSPPLFGTWKDIPLWGLPGNPVSSHVVFRVLTAPWIRRQSKASGPREVKVRVRLADPVKAMADGLTLRRIDLEFTPEGLIGRVTTHQGSSNLHGLATAAALTLLPPGSSGAAGEWIDALLL